VSRETVAIVVFLAVLSLGGLARPASAQTGPELFASVGTLRHAPGWNAGAGIGFRPVPAIGVFVNVEYWTIPAGRQVNTDPARRVISTTDWRGERSVSVLAGLQLSVFPRSRLSPYVLAAYGRGQISRLAGGAYSPRDDFGATLHFGGGLRAALSPNVSLFAEGRFTITDVADDPDLKVPIKLGVAWQP
jgi:hypothetical protein